MYEVLVKKAGVSCGRRELGTDSPCLASLFPARVPIHFLLPPPPHLPPGTHNPPPPSSLRLIPTTAPNTLMQPRLLVPPFPSLATEPPPLALLPADAPLMHTGVVGKARKGIYAL
jgi:hypothetical protein